MAGAGKNNIHIIRSIYIYDYHIFLHCVLIDMHMSMVQDCYILFAVCVVVHFLLLEVTICCYLVLHFLPGCASAVSECCLGGMFLYSRTFGGSPPDVGRLGWAGPSPSSPLACGHECSSEGLSKPKIAHVRKRYTHPRFSFGNLSEKALVDKERQETVKAFFFVPAVVSTMPDSLGIGDCLHSTV